MNNSFFYKSYWHIQNISSKDWLLLKSEAALSDLHISLLTKKKSYFPGLCLVYSNSFSNHHSLISRFNQITNKKMTFLMYQKGNKIFAASYGLNPNNSIPIQEFLQNSLAPIQQTQNHLVYSLINISLNLKR